MSQGHRVRCTRHRFVDRSRSADLSREKNDASLNDGILSVSDKVVQPSALCSFRESTRCRTCLDEVSTPYNGTAGVGLTNVCAFTVPVVTGIGAVCVESGERGREQR